MFTTDANRNGVTLST